MIGTYEFACTIVDAVHTTTDKGTAIRQLENIKQTGVNTTQDGTTHIHVKNFKNCKDLGIIIKLIE